MLGDQRYAGELLLVLVGHLLETSALSHRRSRFTEAVCTKRKIAFQANAAPDGQTNFLVLQGFSRRHPSGGAVLDEIASLSTPGCRGALPSGTTLECAIVGVARTPVVLQASAGDTSPTMLLDEIARSCRPSHFWVPGRCRSVTPSECVLLCPLKVRIRTRTHAHVHCDRTTPESPSQLLLDVLRC